MSVSLIPHPSGRSRNWYVDIQVPVQFQKLVGKKRVRPSTGTPDRTLALAEGARIEAKLRAEWLAKKATDAAAGSATETPTRPPLPEGSLLVDVPPPKEYDSPGKPTPLSPSLIRRICAMRMADWEKTVHDDRNINTGDKQKDRIAAKALAREMKPFSRRVDRMTRTVIARGNVARAWDDVAEQALEYAEDVGYLVAPDDPLLHDFVLAFAETERVAHEVITTVLNGKGAEFPVPASSGALLSAVIPEYETHKRGSIERKSISKSVSVWQRLIAFVGDVPVNDVTAHDIYRFLEHRLHAKVKPWAQSYADGFVRQALREFFALARTQGHMHADNPMNHLETTPKISKQEEKARKKPRKPFTVAQVNTVFASDWYDPDATHWTGKMSTDLAGRYWAPLISDCHGVRVREVVQLVNSDFTWTGDVLLMTFQTELPDNEVTRKLPPRTLKNESARRTIPVHPKLLELGLGDFISKMQAGHLPGTPLFPSAVPNPGGKAPLWGRSYEQAFLRHVRDRLGFGNGFGNHSGRHQHEDRLRDTQLKNGTWPAGLGEFISGRRLPRDADRDIFREQSSAIDYGNGFIAENVQRFVAQIDLAGVVFPLPYAQWLARRT
ncbi:hypothetical protein P0D72_07545 [Paraburkholderia sediminicola]|uniref:DUF6538 domain-containing protein n=1 Tax=Paraburkholderia sediminicola TaxID=458836 RepID=UPI0038BB760D